MVWKRKFLVNFEDGQKIEMISCSPQYLYLKKKVSLEMDKPISNRLKNNRVNCSLLMNIMMLNKFACLK